MRWQPKGASRAWRALEVAMEQRSRPNRRGSRSDLPFPVPAFLSPLPRVNGFDFLHDISKHPALKMLRRLDAVPCSYGPADQHPAISFVADPACFLDSGVLLHDAGISQGFFAVQPRTNTLRIFVTWLLAIGNAHNRTCAVDPGQSRCRPHCESDSTRPGKGRQTCENQKGSPYRLQFQCRG